jgi:hypothetical protein
MAAQTIDYAALAKQAEQDTAAQPGKVDYAALARQAEAEANPTPPANAPSVPYTLPPSPTGFVEGMRNNLARNTAPMQPNGGFLHDYVLRPFVNTANRAGQDIASPLLDFADGLTDTPEQRQAKGEAAFNSSVIGRAMNDKNPNPSMSGAAADAAQFMGDAVTPMGIPAGSRLRSFVQDAKQSPMNAATNAAGDVLAAGLTGAVAHGAASIPGLAKDAIRGPINEPIAGGTLTPATRYASAKRLGVNLDAADATNSPLFGAVKRVNSNSLFGGPTYEAAKGQNTSALTGSTDRFLTGLYDGDRESGGLAIQKALQRNQQGLYGSATDGFESLPRNIPIPGLEEVGKTAQSIVRQNSAYQDLFPSLKPTKAMNVVGDVGGLGSTAPAPLKMSPFVNESGQPIPSSAQAPPPQSPSFGTGQQLRSDLLDFYRNNPDIVQNQGNGFIQRLAGQTDDALTNASSALTPDQLGTFRAANADWKDMKATYDDPSSPFYHAVRTENPSSLYGGIGSKTPENARNILGRLSPNGISPGDSPAVGALRRGTVESALKTTNDGSPNFRTFGTQLNRIPADYRAELFSPDQNRGLYDIANTSNALSQEFNPSGSGHQVQKLGEAASLFQSPVTALSGHPLLAAAPVAYNAAQYGAAKLMNSPALVDRLMSPTVRPGLFAPPTATNPFTPPLVGRAAMFGAPAAGNYSGLYGTDDKKKKAR